MSIPRSVREAFLGGNLDHGLSWWAVDASVLGLERVLCRTSYNGSNGNAPKRRSGLLQALGWSATTYFVKF